MALFSELQTVFCNGVTETECNFPTEKFKKAA